MTPAEIMALEGRELDIAVGKLVFGCTVRKQRNRERYDLIIPGGVNSIDWTTEAGAWSGMPPLSSTWQGMGLVVEAMEKRRLGFRLNGYYHAAFFHDTKPCHWVTDDSASLAVARAALLAVRGE